MQLIIRAGGKAAIRRGRTKMNLGVVVGKLCYLYINHRTNPPALFIDDAHRSSVLVG